MTAPSPTPPARRDLRPLAEAAALTLVALAVRIAAAWTLGEGAPFGPDGTGAEAAVHLGGHLYPLHIAGIAAVGSARTLSVICGALTCPLLWWWGRRVGLGGGGGWLAAFVPLTVFPSALSAGDAPAILVVVMGVLLSTFGRWPGALAGGALAMAAVWVKPIALPAATLLVLRPLSLLGAAATLPWTAPWLEPLWAPRPRSGLLGSWWQGNHGGLPGNPEELNLLIRGGVHTLLQQPSWVCLWLVAFAVVGAAASARWVHQDPPPLERCAVAVPILGLLAVASLQGDQLHARYLEGALLAILPWAALILPRGAEALALWPTAALVTQVAAYRADHDRGAVVPALPVLPYPAVDARPIFDSCSTRDATRMRAEAHRMARDLPEGDTVRVQRLPHGREGELVWPLKVLRPDLNFEFE